MLGALLATGFYKLGKIIEVETLDGEGPSHEHSHGHGHGHGHGNGGVVVDGINATRAPSGAGVVGNGSGNKQETEMVVIDGRKVPDLEIGYENANGNGNSNGNGMKVEL